MQDKQTPSFKNQSAIRQHCLNIRNSISVAQLRAASHSVCAQIIASDSYRQAQHIAAYLAVGKEIDLQALIQQAAQDNKSIYLPRIDGQDIVLAEYTGQNNLHKNRFGILEPSAESKTISAALLDAIYLPLVAFDQHGHRIGMGGGYYDRYLSSVKNCSQPLRVGVAYAEQQVDDCQANDWDVALHTVIQAK